MIEAKMFQNRRHEQLFWFSNEEAAVAGTISVYIRTKYRKKLEWCTYVCVMQFKNNF